MSSRSFGKLACEIYAGNGKKQAFDGKTVPALHQGLADGRFADLGALQEWLRGEVAAMTPGSDPLPAVKAPVAHLCGEWAGEVESEARRA